MLDHTFMQHSELDLPQGDILCMSSGDGVCTLGQFAFGSSLLTDRLEGSSKSITTLHYTERLSASTRRLPSDALSLHHSSTDLVFAGLRSSSIVLEDLRAPSKLPNIVASMVRGKAVVGVKRLRDSVAPWGLVASAMGDEVSGILNNIARLNVPPAAAV